MKIALIDVDGHSFPNLPLMKLSTWHKKHGDNVDWYEPLTAWYEPPDIVYMSKVFTFTPDYPHPINARKIIKGGTGYFYPNGGNPLNKMWNIVIQIIAFTLNFVRILHMVF